MSSDDARELTDQVLAAEQDERRRIALFLHDGPVQSLAGVALMLDAANDFLERGETEQAREVLARALARTRTTVGELRDLSFNLEPVVLRDHGFGMAVHALAQTRGLEHEIQVELDVERADELSERTQAALYQIVREALENAIHRGPPSHFRVTVDGPVEERCRVVVEDDAPGERRKRTIEVLEERVRTLGATLAVEQGDSGTTMTLELPAYG
ncbi:MAG TPA: histidine kinase [Gaiellaceae bacterium]|nr:histidine kinase [Gaiellaceae bacterium]